MGEAASHCENVGYECTAAPPYSHGSHDLLLSGNATNWRHHKTIPCSEIWTSDVSLCILDTHLSSAVTGMLDVTLNVKEVCPLLTIHDTQTRETWRENPGTGKGKDRLQRTRFWGVRGTVKASCFAPVGPQRGKMGRLENGKQSREEGAKGVSSLQRLRAPHRSHHNCYNRIE